MFSQISWAKMVGNVIHDLIGLGRGLFDALTSGIIHLESRFPPGNVTQDLFGLGGAPLDDPNRQADVPPAPRTIHRDHGDRTGKVPRHAEA
jgi:hypothetical protein